VYNYYYNNFPFQRPFFQVNMG